MPLALAPLAVGALLGLLAALIVAARPAHAPSRTLFALLALQAGATLAYASSRAAVSPADALAYARMHAWYTIAYPVLVATLVAQLFPPVRPRAWARTARVGGWALTATAAAAMAFAPELLVAGVRATAAGAFATTSGPLGYALTAAATLASAGAVVAAAQAATSRARTAWERRQAALFGLAFAFLAAHSGANYLLLVVDRLVRGSVSPLFLLVAAAGLCALVAVLWAARPLASAFDGRPRALAWGALALPLVLGAVDGVLGPLALRDAIVLASYDNGVLLRRAAFATLLAAALVRYDLAALGVAARRRAAAATQIGLVIAGALLAAGGALAFLGLGAGALVGAALLAALALALSPVPARAAVDAVARRLLPDPAAPDAVAERARAYRSALREALGPEGGVTDEARGGLARLREELGLTEREHDLLLASVREERIEPARVPLLGRYRVDRELARGASATALLAHDPVLDRPVILKRYHARDVQEAALREARLLAHARHERVVRLLDVDRAGDDIFLVLEYAAGGSARQLLDREGPLPAERAVDLADDVLSALGALHAAGLVHRDVKLENVLLDAQGRALLGDLGSARLARPPSRETTLTGAAIAGTLATLAPEVLRGERATPASDVYGAGAALYRLLTGQHYVELEGLDALRAAERVLNAPPRLPHPRVPAALTAVLQRALAKRPEDRFADAAALRGALAAWREAARRAAPAGA